MSLHHAVVVAAYGEVADAHAFAGADEALAFAAGVEIGARASMGDLKDICSFILDEHGSLAVSNEGLAAAKAAGWTRKDT